MLVIFICTPMLLYWLVRTWLVLYGPEDKIQTTLEGDFWISRHFAEVLRALFQAPGNFA